MIEEFAVNAWVLEVPTGLAGCVVSIDRDEDPIRCVGYQVKFGNGTTRWVRTRDLIRLDTPPPPVATGHPDFYSIIEEMKALHEKKAADYGLGKDVLANCRGSTEFGMPAWVGVAMRMNDKMTRLKAFAQKGTLANESVEDSLIDLANYSILALILYREVSKA